MGSANTKAFKDLMEETCGSTPTLRRKSVEEVMDPRSPATDFDRSLIQVEKDPDLVVDPRSPSYGITRTPIYAGSKEIGEVAESDNSVTSSPVRPKNLDLMETQESPFADVDRPRTESDSSVEILGRSSSNPDLSTDSRCLISNKPRSSTPAKKKTNSLLQNNSNSSPSKHSQRSPLSILSDLPARRRQRKSHDTPKAIIQRKQASKLFAAKNQSEIRVYCDKENMSMK